jgi:hypothetical protein
VTSLDPVAATVAVDRRAPVKSSRSTLATLADLEPYVAALFGSEGVPLCPDCQVLAVPTRAAESAESTCGMKFEPPVVRSFDAASIETGAAVVRPANAPAVRRLVGSGRELDGQDVLIVDPQSCEALPPGELGEIVRQAVVPFVDLDLIAERAQQSAVARDELVELLERLR